MHVPAIDNARRVALRAAALLFAAAALAVAARPAAAADAFTELDRSHALIMLRDTREAIEKHYFDPGLKGIGIGALADTAKARIEKAASIGETLSAVAQFALELDDSHTFFVPPWQTAIVDYGWTMGMVGDVCEVIDVKADSDAAHQGVARGDVVASVNGLKPTRASLWRIEYLFHTLRPQPGLHVELTRPNGEARVLDLAANVRPRKRVVALNGEDSGADIARMVDEQAQLTREQAPRFVEVGKQALLARLPIFAVDDSVIESLLEKARHHAVLVLDLRGNPGGRMDAMRLLVGGLSRGDVAIGTLKWRERSEPMLAKGKGDEAFTGRVFVLVDARSASASELVARTMQLTERGTVIGDRTAGAVMTSRFHPLRVSHGENVIAYAVSVTEADVIMADGGRLEKKGVTPDFAVLPTAADLAEGRDPALAQALKFAGQDLDAKQAGALLPSR